MQLRHPVRTSFGSDRRYTRRSILASSAVAAAAVVGVACGSDDDAAPGGSTVGSGDGARKQLRVVDGYSPANYFDAGGGLFAIREGIAEGLVRVSFDTKLDGALATDWEQPDDTTWVFTLRPGAVFHDGQAVTPDAVANSLGRVAAATWAPAGLRGATITAGDGTVTIATAKPVPFMPAILADGNTIVLTPESLEGDPARALPVGTGPFKLTSFSPGDRREMVAFDDGWHGAPRVSGVSYLVVPDAQTRANQVRTGQADIDRIVNPSDVPTLRGESSVRVLTQPIPRFRGLFLNTAKPPVHDPRVRTAIAAGIERQVIVDTILEGLSEVQMSLFRKDFPWATPSFEAIPEDRKYAASLLAATGYGPDNPLQISLWTYDARPELPDVAQVLQEQLAPLGIKIDVQVRDLAVVEQEAFSGKSDASLVGRNPLFLLDPQSFYESDFLSSGSYNLSRYSALDAEIAAAATIMDTDERYGRYREFEHRVVTEDAAVVVLNSYLQIDATNASVSGYRPHPTDAIALTTEIARE